MGLEQRPRNSSPFIDKEMSFTLIRWCTPRTATTTGWARSWARATRWGRL